MTKPKASPAEVSPREFSCWMSYIGRLGGYWHHDSKPEAEAFIAREEDARVFFVREVMPPKPVQNSAGAAESLEILTPGDINFISLRQGARINELEAQLSLVRQDGQASRMLELFEQRREADARVKELEAELDRKEKMLHAMWEHNMDRV